MKYRSRVEIIYNILIPLQDGPKYKTRIMYAAYMASEQMREYIPLLLASSLIKYDKDTTLYHIMPKGRKFIEYTALLKQLVDLPVHQRSLIKLQ